MKKAETKDRIKEAMEIREIKQAELVEKTGIDKGQMSSYLSGKYKPKQGNLEKIAKALFVDEAWLMGYDVPMERTVCSKESSPKIMQYYDQLNNIGKHEATKRVEELTLVPRYVKENTPDYLTVQAAHNDAETTDEELEKMERDSILIREMVKKQKQ